MLKKIIETSRKSPRLVEGTSTDEVHAPTFNILTQTPSPKHVETSAKGGSSHFKDQNEKKNEAKKRVSPANQKEKKRKGRIVETPSDFDFDFVKVAQSSKSSTRRTTKKNELEIPISEKGKKVVRNENGAISESEVTSMVASKFGGPRIAKEHALDTSNYPTPRPKKRNLR
ncbi:hypothetical protein H5410_040086 [Solanum commersonii]|uniref:Uncharacterized protein n=1 Tax=Solanum commersonii TaxID=4109 RepID=A0A9J5XQC8_SOLCO|nr:hypothetical protein H5410_040086 [Solanum commersonii]